MLQFVECVYSGPLPAAVDLVIEHSLVCELVSTVLSHSRFFFWRGMGDQTGLVLARQALAPLS